MPALHANELHIWRVPRPDARPELLSAEEISRADRMVVPEARACFIGTRGVLRRLIGAYTDTSAQDVRLEYGEHGKPSLAGTATDLDFSVSHCGTFALLAFARGAPVGVDVERMRAVRRADRLVHRVFSRESARALRAAADDRYGEPFLRAWTQREAYVKAVGGGVLLTPDVLPFQWPVQTRIQDAPDGRWLVVPVTPDTHHVGCVVTRLTAESIHLLDASAVES